MTLSLVTGGAGFIGGRLVQRLKERGERVRVLDLAAPASQDDIQGSVTDENTARRACAGVDTVFHIAGDPQLWSANPKSFDQTNRVGTQVMLAAAKTEGVRRFVHCSSPTVLIGRRTWGGVIDEMSRPDEADMLGAYPLSKLRADRAVEAAVLDGLDAVIAIPTEPLGAGDSRLTPPTRMILDFVNGRTPAFIDCMLNFVAVDSLADGFIALRDRGRRGQRYILGGENIAMRALLDRLEALSGRLMPKTKIPYKVAFAAALAESGLARITGATPRAPLTGVRIAGRPVTFSSEKARRELGWTAGPFEDALVAALKWFERKGLLV